MNKNQYQYNDRNIKSMLEKIDTKVLEQIVRKSNVKYDATETITKTKHLEYLPLGITIGHMLIKVKSWDKKLKDFSESEGLNLSPDDFNLKFGLGVVEAEYNVLKKNNVVKKIKHDLCYGWTDFEFKSVKGKSQLKLFISGVEVLIFFFAYDNQGNKTSLLRKANQKKSLFSALRYIVDISSALTFSSSSININDGELKK